MSVRIYIRSIETQLWLSAFEPHIELSNSAAEARAFPNLVAAQEAHRTFAERTAGMRMEAVAADPCGEASAVFLCELEQFEPVELTPLRGAVELFAMLKKSSKYHGQFPGWSKVTAIIAASYGDAYCFRVAYNAYRHDDLIFSVKVGGEFMRLDKWVAPKAERRAA